MLSREIAAKALIAAYRDLLDLREEERRLSCRKIRLQLAIKALSAMPECAKMSVKLPTIQQNEGRFPKRARPRRRDT